MPRRRKFEVGQRISFYDNVYGTRRDAKVIEVGLTKMIVRDDYGFRHEVKNRNAKIL